MKRDHKREGVFVVPEVTDRPNPERGEAEEQASRRASVEACGKPDCDGGCAGSDTAMTVDEARDELINFTMRIGSVDRTEARTLGERIAALIAAAHAAGRAEMREEAITALHLLAAHYQG